MAEVTIRGAGIFGLSIAWTCLRRGARVTVIDPAGPGRGASGGLVGALAPHVPENWNEKKQFQLESLLMAERFWAGVADAAGVDPGYARSGRVQPVADERALALARNRAETARELWRGAARWTVEPVQSGWAPASATGWVIRDDLSARLHPRHACAALVAALRSGGCEIVSDGEDRGLVIWATGVAGLEALGVGRPRTVGVGVKGQAALLRYSAGRDAPQLYADGVHVIPHADGTVAVGSTSERDWKDARGTDALLDAVIARARAVVPDLSDAPVIERWAGVRPRARSRAPILGPWPGRPSHFVANGGFKIGFGMAPRVAAVMADLVLDGVDTIPEGFRVETSF